MAGTFVGTIELTDIGDIKISGTDIQKIFVGALQVFPPPSGAFEPSDIAGLQVWLDASDAATITETGGIVDQWDDKSGNGNDVAQSLAAEKPLLTTDGGFDSLQFDGAADRLINTTASISVANGTMYCVLRVITFADTKGWFGLGVGASVNYQGTRTTDQIRMNFSSMAADPNFSRDFSDKFWARGTWTGSSAVDITDDDGGTDSRVATSTLGTVDGLVVGGRRISGGTSGVACHIHEILCYDTVLSSGDQTLVETYLESKWGFP